MDSCARCKKSVLDHEKLEVRRRDSSTVILCPDCVADIRADRKQQQVTEPTAVAPPTSQPADQQNPSSKSDDKWYKTIGFGVLLLIGTVILAYFLNGLENGTVSSFRVWWPIALLYNAFGFWGGVACPGFISLFVLGIGVKELIEQQDES